MHGHSLVQCRLESKFEKSPKLSAEDTQENATVHNAVNTCPFMEVAAAPHPSAAGSMTMLQFRVCCSAVSSYRDVQGERRVYSCLYKRRVEFG